MRVQEGCEGRGEGKNKSGSFCLLSIRRVLSRVQRASWPTVGSPRISP